MARVKDKVQESILECVTMYMHGHNGGGKTFMSWAKYILKQ